MGKKKKKSEERNSADQILLFVPSGVPAPPSPPLAPIPSAGITPPPPSDQAKIASPAFLEKVRVDAIEWAKECGLKPPFTVDGPERVNYSRYGHGYVVTIREDTGKRRLGSARFSRASAALQPGCLGCHCGAEISPKRRPRGCHGFRETQLWHARHFPGKAVPF